MSFSFTGGCQKVGTSTNGKLGLNQNLSVGAGSYLLSGRLHVFRQTRAYLPTSPLITALIRLIWRLLPLTRNGHWSNCQLEDTPLPAEPTTPSRHSTTGPMQWKARGGHRAGQLRVPLDTTTNRAFLSHPITRL